MVASLFSIVGMMATGVFLNVSRGQQQVGSKSTLYDDAQFILDQLSKEIAGGAVDYEEYYNRIVLEGMPGMNFGHYASQFYYDLVETKTCPKTSPTCVNIGKNPPASNFPEKSSAFYQAGVSGEGIFCDDFEPIFSTAKGHTCVTQLYVITPDGTRKTFIAPEKIYWEGSNEKKTSYILSRAQMVAYKDAKGDTIAHLFQCEKGKEMCSGELTGLKTINLNNSPATVDLTYPDPDDLKGVKGQGATAIEKAYNQGKDFLPFTPSRVNIKSMRFYIGPPEDPRKAIGEANEDAGTVTNVHQPRVTIVLTIEPISNVKSGTSYPALTAQTTVTPGMFTEIGSYPPQMEAKGK